MTMLGTVAAALAGAALFELLKVPAGALVGALVAVAAYNIWAADGAVALPGWARFAAFAAVGWLIGQGITREALSSLRAEAWSMAVIVVALIGVGAVVAFALTQFGPLDGTTAFLASSPGGLSQMAALSTEFEADSPYVATVHIVRVVVVIMSAPIVARLVDVV